MRERESVCDKQLPFSNTLLKLKQQKKRMLYIPFVHFICPKEKVGDDRWLPFQHKANFTALFFPPSIFCIRKRVRQN